MIPRYDPGLKSDSKTMLPAVVEIKTIDGMTFSKRVDLVYGHPQNPMSWDDLVEKFKDCASYSAKADSREEYRSGNRKDHRTGRCSGNERDYWPGSVMARSGIIIQNLRTKRG